MSAPTQVASSSKPLEAFWAVPPDQLARALHSSESGLTSAQAQARAAQYASRRLGGQREELPLRVLLRQFLSPIVLLLIGAAVLSGALGDLTDAVIIMLIVLASGLLSFWQEYGAGRAVAKLLEQVEVKTTVLRDGQPKGIPLEDVLPGDVVLLSAGDLVPGDGLVLEEHDLAVNEASLTGESFPAEKGTAPCAPDAALIARRNALWLGTHVESGTGKLLVVRIGRDTEFGHIGAASARRAPENAFERGIKHFGYFLAEITLLLVILIFAINVLLHRPPLDAFLFSLALAVGLTPQLLPAIISVNLASGARRMAAQQVIVKKLVAIENFGSMNVLCSDKTGTLTEGTVALRATLNPGGVEDASVRRLAALNATLQSGFANPIDEALKAAVPDAVGAARKLDEVPYDFTRKRLSVLVQDGNQRTLICKGALANVLDVCTLTPQEREDALQRFQTLSATGSRVLGLATKPFSGDRLGREDETGLTFAGFLVLEDPLKPGIQDTVKKLQDAGVQLKILTGDNAAVARYMAGLAGLQNAEVVTGHDLDTLSTEALPTRVAGAQVFAELEPRHKERLIAALKHAGLTVGYMGDGINDVPALRAADVSLSVDDATDIAKDAADIVLLRRDLGVLLSGILEGRRTFANTLKYVFMATSANFGNMFSMAVGSLLLPFLPLLPKQILLINFLTDLPEMTLPTDRVNRELLARPQGWDLRFIRRFMLVFGPISSVYDLATFGVLRGLLHANAPTLRTGWFLESVISAALVVLALRTRRPLVGSQPSRYLLGATLAVIVLTVALPFTPLAAPLGFVAVPFSVLVWVTLLIALYVLSVEVAKRFFYRPVSSAF